MRPDIKDNYMKAILGETEYEYRIESAVEEAVEEAVEQVNAEHEARIDAIKKELLKIGLSSEVIDTVLGNSESK